MTGRIRQAITLERIAAAIAAATIGGYLQGKVEGWPLDGLAVTGALVAVLGAREWRRRRRTYPPAPEPLVERAGTRESDGTPCRGWPALDQAVARAGDLRPFRLGDDLERDPWPR